MLNMKWKYGCDLCDRKKKKYWYSAAQNLCDTNDSY